jgi:peptide/nickel transport system substrate-binding protein
VDPESLSIELMAYNDRPEFADVAAVIQDQLGQLGVKVKIKSAEYAALEPDALSGDFDAFLLSRGYLVDVADPGGYFLSDWTCDGGYNIARYCDPETDQMIADAVAIEEAAARSDAYAEIAEKLQSEAASVFLVHEHGVYGTKAEVANFEPHPQEYYVLTADLSLG